jgi:hypothetical protein
MNSWLPSPSTSHVGPVLLTSVLAVAELLPGVGSGVDELTVAVFVTVPAAVAGAIAVVSVKTPLPAAPSDAIVHEIVPPAPTGGVVHDQPPGAVSETNLALAGSGSDIVTDAAALGPLLVTVRV